MTRVVTAATPTGAKFISATNTDFWTSVGIFEEALREKADTAELLADEFEADKQFTKVARTLAKSTSRLVKLIKAALSKAGVRLLGIHSLPDDTVVVATSRI